jgi:hypothetical protein
MSIELFEFTEGGKTVRAPSTRIDGRVVLARGRWIKTAEIHDEFWLEGPAVGDPGPFLAELKRSGLGADLFTFAERIPQTRPGHPYHVEWDNVAAIPIISYQDWWAGLSTDMRKDIKRAAQREVVTRAVALDEELVRGIVDIHDESPLRQGSVFRHYGKDFDTVKREYGTFPERSEFIGAYLKDELIGLIKMVYVGELACMMQILSKARHFDKRPTNALIAKAVEICEAKGKSYLTYGKYYYGNKVKSSLVDFKHRNGFVRILFPRYYVPLTAKGRAFIRLRLYRGPLGLLPGGLISLLVGLRSFVNRRIRPGTDAPRPARAGEKPAGPGRGGDGAGPDAA